MLQAGREAAYGVSDLHTIGSWHPGTLPTTIDSRASARMPTVREPECCSAIYPPRTRIQAAQPFPVPPRYDFSMTATATCLAWMCYLYRDGCFCLRARAAGAQLGLPAVLSLRLSHSVRLAQAPAPGNGDGLERQRAALMTGQWSASWDMDDLS